MNHEPSPLRLSEQVELDPNLRVINDTGAGLLASHFTDDVIDGLVGGIDALERQLEDRARIDALIERLPLELRASFVERIKGQENYGMVRRALFYFAEDFIATSIQLSVEEVTESDFETEMVPIRLMVMKDLVKSLFSIGINLRSLVRANFLQSMKVANFDAVLPLYKDFFAHHIELMVDTLRLLAHRRRPVLFALFAQASPEGIKEYVKSGGKLTLDSPEISPREALLC